jgi:hypothetical protein
VSFGGSALVISMAAAGILVNIARVGEQVAGAAGSRTARDEHQADVVTLARRRSLTATRPGSR